MTLGTLYLLPYNFRTIPYHNSDQNNATRHPLESSPSPEVGLNYYLCYHFKHIQCFALLVDRIICNLKF